MTFQRMLVEQDELIAIAGELQRLADQPRPPKRDTLTQVRWRFARTLLQHMPRKDRLVYARLRQHPDPAVAAVGARFSTEAHAIYEMFERHTARWTPEAVEAHWVEYCNGVRLMVTALHNRVDREKKELLPHLASAPDVSPARSYEDRNWASDGWKIRETLGVD